MKTLAALLWKRYGQNKKATQESILHFITSYNLLRLTKNVQTPFLFFGINSFADQKFPQ